MKTLRCPKCHTRKIARYELDDDGNLHFEQLELARSDENGRRKMGRGPTVVTPLEDRAIPLRCRNCGIVDINLVTDIDP